MGGILKVTVVTFQTDSARKTQAPEVKGVFQLFSMFKQNKHWLAQEQTVFIIIIIYLFLFFICKNSNT